MSIRLWGRSRIAPAPQRNSDSVVVLIWLVALLAIVVVFAMGMR